MEMIKKFGPQHFFNRFRATISHQNAILVMPLRGGRRRGLCLDARPHIRQIKHQPVQTLMSGNARVFAKDLQRDRCPRPGKSAHADRLLHLKFSKPSTEHVRLNRGQVPQEREEALNGEVFEIGALLQYL